MPAKVNGASGPRRPQRASVAKPARAAPVRREVEAIPERGATFDADATAVLLPLQASLAAVLDALPGRLERSTDLQRVLKSDPKLAWQIFKFCHAPAVLPASSSLPGTVAMQRFFKLAAKNGVDRALIDASAAVLAAFEAFVTERAGDRRSFNTMAGGGRNDGQAVNLAHKKAVFRAAAHFLGVQTDCVAMTILLHPSAATPGGWDLAMLVYKIGIRRLRSDARVRLARVHVDTDKPDENAPQRLEPIEPHVDPKFVPTLLPPFCSNASADTVMRRYDDGTVAMEIAAGSVGLAGATDWAFGVVERNCSEKPGPGRHIQLSASNVVGAVEKLIVDVFVVQPDGLEPSTKVLSYLSLPSVDQSDSQRLNLNESVTAQGRGDVAAQRSEVPRYNELVHYACDRLGWNPADFQVYRCRVDYPVLGTSVDVHLDYPDAPADV